MNDPQMAAFQTSKVHIIRLLPGTDVRDWIETWSKDQSIHSASIISAVGSLSDAAIRFAGAEKETSLQGPYEIVSLSGLISRNGAHLHASISDSKGRVVGGHVARGCIVRTTLELAIAEYQNQSGLELRRESDARTGYSELFIRPIEPADSKEPKAR